MECEINPFSDVPTATQEEPTRFTFEMPQAPILELPEQDRMNLWAEAFTQLANAFAIPAAWIVLKSVPGIGVQTLIGGHAGSAQTLMGMLAVQTRGNPVGSNTRCVVCQKEIPPGKAGRKCEDCRNKERSRIIIP